MSDSNPGGPLRPKVRIVLDQLRAELLAQRNAQGHWIGELSPSALSTATAASAMSAVLLQSPQRDDAGRLGEQINRAVDYLAGQQNDDGGFGDTDRSHSNIATSYLVLAALSLAQRSIGRTIDDERITRLRHWIDAGGGLPGLRRRYGKDKTFVVPIMTNLAIAGLVDWSEVAALPFEAAIFPQSMYRFLGMPVVSYAIPALVAIGQARHFHGPRALLPLRLLRAAAVKPTLRVLRRMQPASGGYLEATPLTSFVVMSLAATGRADLEVSREGLRFLLESMNAEGSWPIDTNLATWVTSLAIGALASDPADDGSWCQPSLVQWHLDCQHTERHPFTGAEPGGWGWSDLDGAVPDSDDTPAAMLALGQMRGFADPTTQQRMDIARSAGRDWLLKLQNRDGGWPTFCRGWGKLPFDRSSTDLTGHASRALANLQSSESAERSSESARTRSARALRGACDYLQHQQQDDGSWLPLWFGNQDRDDESNPVYGTSRVLIAAAAVGLSAQAVAAGRNYLIANQNRDGGWGGGRSLPVWIGASGGTLPSDLPLLSSVEETALAVDALISVASGPRNLGPDCGVQSGQELPKSGDFDVVRTGGGKNDVQEAIIRGIEFLLGSVDDGRHRVPWPIGFYFAKLWYHERLYPLIFTVAAFGKYLEVTPGAVSAPAASNQMQHTK